MAVLRQLPFGDIHAGHDLETGNNGLTEQRRHLHDLLQDAANAKAQSDCLCLRFQMNITGLQHSRLLQDEIHQTDDARKRRFRRRCSCLQQGAFLLLTFLTDGRRTAVAHFVHGLAHETQPLSLLIFQGKHPFRLSDLLSFCRFFLQILYLFLTASLRARTKKSFIF